jgi:hypothetical protein
MKPAYRCLVVTMMIVATLLVEPSGLPSATTAAASDRVLLGGGAGIQLDGDNLCTLTTIGHDRAGELVGFTSAHCSGPGATVATDGAAGTAGSVVAANDDLDYAVIRFDPTKVTPISNFDGFAINGIGPDPPQLQQSQETRMECQQHRPNVCVDVIDPSQYQISCQQSRATGRACADIIGPSRDPATLNARECANPDDSGAPVTVNDLLIGMIRGGFIPNIPCPQTSSFTGTVYFPVSAQPEVVSINAIIADASAKGGPGAGFVPA